MKNVDAAYTFEFPRSRAALLQQQQKAYHKKQKKEVNNFDLRELRRNAYACGRHPTIGPYRSSNKRPNTPKIGWASTVHTHERHQEFRRLYSQQTPRPSGGYRDIAVEVVSYPVAQWHVRNVTKVKTRSSACRDPKQVFFVLLFPLTSNLEKHGAMQR
jgi:hypothetical protein